MGSALAGAAALAAGIALPSIVGGDDVLEPSIQNEVDHAVSLGEKWLADFARTNAPPAARLAETNAPPARAAETNAPPARDLFATNALTREQIALKIVRAQRARGFWTDPSTNNVPVEAATRLAVEILNSL